MDYKKSIETLKEELGATIVAHYYQCDDVFECADITGDSLELAKRARDVDGDFIIFCGVSFMGESVKILDPTKRVFMPSLASCSMAEMIDDDAFDRAIEMMVSSGIDKENILPITYINSSAIIKAKVGEMGGLTCTSSNAKKIMEDAKKSGKKIFFMPDQCLGANMAGSVGLSSTLLEEGKNLQEYDVICYDGFCSIHQYFELKDIEFFRAKYDGIKIAVHPECKPEVCDGADFVGSTSQIIKFVQDLPLEQKVAIGTEANLVNRLREKNTYILSSTLPMCPSMSETTIEGLHSLMIDMLDGYYRNEVEVNEVIAKNAKLALDAMMELS
ncbi:MAG: quinolinate synthase NadA [Campylobacterales bacterium]